jgi:hypothetical protein
MTHVSSLCEDGTEPFHWFEEAQEEITRELQMGATFAVI